MLNALAVEQSHKTIAAHDAVDMRMKLECLSPGVHDGEETDPGAEMPGVGGHFEQRGGAGFEQQREQPSLILPH